MPTEGPKRSPRADFPTTHWSLVLGSNGDTPKAAVALERLCTAYWTPLYTFLRRQGATPQDAEDLVQGFLSRLLERQDLSTVGPEKGRFRTYLLTALRNFAVKRADHDKAYKRGGGRVILSLDAAEAERATVPDLSAPTPEAAFDRQWARTLLSRAMVRLREEHIARRKEQLFETLAPFLDGADPNEYETAGRLLNLKRGAVAVAVHRMRMRMRELLEAEVLETVGRREQVDAELQELLQAVANR